VCLPSSFEMSRLLASNALILLRRLEARNFIRLQHFQTELLEDPEPQGISYGKYSVFYLAIIKPIKLYTQPSLATTPITNQNSLRNNGN